MQNRLSELRNKQGETQQEMAQIMGLKSAAAYCKKELGYRPVTLAEAHALAVHFNTTIEEIFFAEENSK